jgi:hypothetical protein
MSQQPLVRALQRPAEHADVLNEDLLAFIQS